MTHEHSGHYSAKHPEGAKPDSRIVGPLKKMISENRITCAAAHGIAEGLSLSPAQIGATIDLMETRIIRCQMGLFGYTPQKRIVEPAIEIDGDLKAAIEKNTMDGRISCQRCWEIAKTQRIPKMSVAAACEALKVKIGPCQLGAF
jgi:hypothetical protein